jgi:hypothetical protein
MVSAVIVLTSVHFLTDNKPAGQLALLLTSLPQHSCRAGKFGRSQPPPRAWINDAAFAMRRPRIFTA